MNNQTIIADRPVQIDFMVIENAAKSKLSAIDKRKIELKEKKEQLDGYYFSDQEYLTLEEQRKILLKKRKTIREKVLKIPEAYKKYDEVKAVRKDIKNAKLDLSDLLLQYEQEANTNILTDDDGTMLTIVKTAKIAGK